MYRYMRQLPAVSIVLPGILLVLTTIYLVDALGLGAPIDRRLPTPSFFPIVLAALMYVAIFAVLLKTFRGAARTAETEDAENPDDRAEVNSKTPLVVFAAVSIYVLLFTYFGYIVTTPVFIYVMLHIFKYGNPASAGGQIRRVIAAIAITALIYAFFVAGFSVRLPGIGS